MADQNTLVSVATNSNEFIENVRALRDQLQPNYPVSALLAERDSGGAGRDWTNDLLTVGRDDKLDEGLRPDSRVEPTVSAQQAAGDLRRRNHVPVPVNTPFETWAEYAEVMLAATGAAMPGMAGDISKQEAWLMKQGFKALERAIVSNRRSVRSTSDTVASRTAGLVTYSRGADAIPVGSATAGYTNEGYDKATRLTRGVNDLAAQAEANRAYLSLAHVLTGAQRLFEAQSGANIMEGGEGQMSTLQDGDFIAVIPQRIYPHIQVPTSGVASQVRITDTDMVYKMRRGTTEGLCYPMSVSFIKTTFGSVFLTPAMEQSTDLDANEGKLAFMFDPSATEIVWKRRFEPKRPMTLSALDQVLVRGVFAVAGILPNHVRAFKYVRRS